MTVFDLLNEKFVGSSHFQLMSHHWWWAQCSPSICKSLLDYLQKMHCWGLKVVACWDWISIFSYIFWKRIFIISELITSTNNYLYIRSRSKIYPSFHKRQDIIKAACMGNDNGCFSNVDTRKWLKTPLTRWNTAPAMRFLVLCCNALLW